MHRNLSRSTTLTLSPVDETPEVRFGILGPLSVGVEGEGGQRLGLGGRKQRELLALLLINLNRCLPASRIADALWRGSPPAGADITLRTHVSHLRRRLAEVGAQDALVTRQAGYGLFLRPDQVDAARFEQLLTLGQAARSAGQPQRAADLLSEALGLWRGTVLEDLGSPDFGTTEAARLAELRLVALDQRIDADLALGKHRDVIAELEGLVVAHPFRERLHCQLMVALYRSGRQADALAVSAAVRRRLDEELGVDPSPALRDVETAILRQDRALTPRPRQGREVRMADGVNVARVTIDGDGSDAVWFLTQLIESVRSACPQLTVPHSPLPDSTLPQQFFNAASR
jgi:serine/threonine-protein kinase PknK